MDWIHCNVCFQQPSREKAFSLTSCGHMYCSDCLGNGTQDGECKICQSKCTCIQLVQDMESDVKDFFSQPEDILTKLLQVLEFQKKHRMKLTAHWMSMNKKCEETKAENHRLRAHCAKLYNNMKILQKQYALLKNSLSGSNSNAQQIQMTPFVSPPVHGHMYSVKTNPKQMIPNSSVTQMYPNLVTPHRLTKHRNSANPHYSGIHGFQVKNANPQHSFLTPPNDSPQSGAVYKYVRP